MSKLIKVDKNGTQYFFDGTCRRCGGAGGGNQWAYTGYTCYRCGGTGVDPQGTINKVYTPEYQAKLNAAAKARAEKKQAEADAKFETEKPKFMEKAGFGLDNGEYATFRAVGNTYEIKDQLKELGFKFDSNLGWHIDHIVEGIELQRLAFTDVADGMNCWGTIAWKSYDEVKALWVEEIARKEKATRSEQVYNVGDKVNLKDVEFVCLWSGSGFAYGTSAYIYKITDGDNIYIWKTGNCVANGKHNITATVKALEVRNGVKQTVLTRCKVND